MSDSRTETKIEKIKYLIVTESKEMITHPHPHTHINTDGDM